MALTDPGRSSGAAALRGSTASRSRARCGASTTGLGGRPHRSRRPHHHRLVHGSTASYQTARMIDGVARIVVASEPDELGVGCTADRARVRSRGPRAHNRDLVDDSTLDEWLPSIHQDGSRRAGHPVRPGVPPTPLRRAGMVNVLTVPVADQLEPRDGQRAGLQPDRLRVEATTCTSRPRRGSTRPRRWKPATTSSSILRRPPPTSTASPSRTRSGDLRGVRTRRRLGDGPVRPVRARRLPAGRHHRRPAVVVGWPSRSAPSRCSTSGTASWSGGARSATWVGASGSRRSASTGDRAYVVTYRQIDPFYVVDLADPGRPRGGRRAGAARVLQLPPPDRRRSGARRRPGRHRRRRDRPAPR